MAIHAQGLHASGLKALPEYCELKGVETSTVPTSKLSADDGHGDIVHGAAADTAPGPVVENFQPPSTLLVLAHHPEGQEL